MATFTNQIRETNYGDLFVTGGTNINGNLRVGTGSTNVIINTDPSAQSVLAVNGNVTFNGSIFATGTIFAINEQQLYIQDPVNEIGREYDQGLGYQNRSIPNLEGASVVVSANAVTGGVGIKFWGYNTDANLANVQVPSAFVGFDDANTTSNLNGNVYLVPMHYNGIPSNTPKYTINQSLANTANVTFGNLFIKDPLSGNVAISTDSTATGLSGNPVLTANGQVSVTDVSGNDIFVVDPNNVGPEIFR